MNARRHHFLPAAFTMLLVASSFGEDGAPKALTLDLGDGVTMEFVQIPAGSFMMGSPEDEEGRGNDEGPRHLVTIAKPFYMGKYEVTNAQFRQFYPKHNSRWYIEYEKKEYFRCFDKSL